MMARDSHAEMLKKLPERRAKGKSVWKCSECGCKNSYALSKACQNCGRDISGNPGRRPTGDNSRRV